jgi:hypothetical protein
LLDDVPNILFMIRLAKVSGAGTVTLLYQDYGDRAPAAGAEHAETKKPVAFTK